MRSIDDSEIQMWKPRVSEQVDTGKWKGKDENLRRLCEQKEETMEPLIRECKEIERGEVAQPDGEYCKGKKRVGSG